MNIRQYLTTKYEAHPSTMLGTEAKVFGIPYPLRLGWLEQHGDREITAEMAEALRSRLGQRGGKSAARGITILSPTSAANSTAPTQPSEREPMQCEDCNGTGEVGEEVYQGEFQPPERGRCDSCNGSGWWKVDAAPTQAPMQPSDEDRHYTIDRAADLLEMYADWIKRNVMSAQIEEHPYLPELEGVAEELRALSKEVAAPTQAAGGEAKSNAREYVAFLEREFGPSKGQNLPHFTIGNVSRAFGAGWIAAAPAAAVDDDGMCRSCVNDKCVTGVECVTLGRDDDPAAAPEGLTGWNLLTPEGNIAATEATCVRAWARVNGYKPTVEGLLGYEQQGWRVVPATPDAKTAEARKP